MYMINSSRKNKNKRVYVSPLTIVFLIVAAFFQSLRPALIAYGVAFVHESAHFLAASCFKIRFSSISIMPFGLSIKLKKEYIEDPKKEFWICFAGPLSNILMFIIGLMISSQHLLQKGYLEFFLSANMMMFLLNMLPILPLDGGRMLKSILTDRYGVIKAFNFTYRIGKVAILFFCIASFYILYRVNFNFSFIILCAFLCYSVFSEKSKNDVFLMKEISRSLGKMNKNSLLKINHMAVSPDYEAIKLISKFSYHTFTVLSVIDHQEEKDHRLTEVQIIEGLINIGTKAQVRDIFAFYY